MDNKNIICKKCGNDNEFYLKHKIKGSCNSYFNLDGTEADNTELHSNLVYSLSSEYIFCSKCKFNTNVKAKDFNLI